MHGDDCKTPFFPDHSGNSRCSVGGQSCLQRIRHRRIENDALLLRPKPARSKRTNRSRDEVNIEILEPYSCESAYVHELGPEFGRRRLQLRSAPAQMQHAHAVRIQVSTPGILTTFPFARSQQSRLIGPGICQPPAWHVLPMQIVQRLRDHFRARLEEAFGDRVARNGHPGPVTAQYPERVVCRTYRRRRHRGDACEYPDNEARPRP